ncbi:MAG: hypothetical protein U0836_01440 [Pirellulales bacterium]
MTDDPALDADLLILRSPERSTADRWQAANRILASRQVSLDEREALFRELLSDGDAQIVWLAARVLRDCAKQEATLAALRQACHSTDQRVREAAFEARAWGGDATLVEDCRPLLDPEQVDFVPAVMALVKLGTPPAFEPLLEAFHQKPAARHTIAVLAASAFGRAAAPLLNYLQQGVDKVLGTPLEQWSDADLVALGALVHVRRAEAVAAFRTLIEKWRADPANERWSRMVGWGVSGNPRVVERERLPLLVDVWLLRHPAKSAAAKKPSGRGPRRPAAPQPADELPGAFRFRLNEWRARLGVNGPIDFSRRADYSETTNWSYGCRELNGHSLTSPIHLVALEDLRSQLAESGLLGQGIPADVFAFGLGEPAERHVTKVGGLPYRPAGEPWPTFRPSEADLQWSFKDWLSRWPSDWPAPPPNLRDLSAWPELPQTFLAQFWFGDSRDLVGDLPGDVLLVFVSDDTSMGEPDAYHFEWREAGLTDLVRPEQLPSRFWRSPVFHGYAHRTCDYEPAEFPELDEFVRGGCKREEAAVWGGTKIGGLSNVPVETPRGRFLCQLGSISPAFDRPYPWINVAEPQRLDRESRRDMPKLDLCDAGFVAFFLDADGQVRPEFWCS